MRIGIIGPEDLTGVCRRVCDGIPDVDAVELPYLHEGQAVALLSGAPSDIDAWLFTGIIPYEIARAANVLTIPATYVEYEGATLLRALVDLLRAGYSDMSISIDILDAAQVYETFTEAGLPTRNLFVLPYTPALSTASVVEFHRAARKDGATVAFSCLRSAYEILRTEQHAVRLTPSVHAIRSAINELQLLTGAALSAESHVAIGLVEIGGRAEDQVRREAATLGATVAHVDDGLFLIVTTRGALEAETDGFMDFPMLRRLQVAHGTAKAGFGMGATAAEAEALARRALDRVRSFDGSAAVLSLRNSIDITLEIGRAARTSRRTAAQVLASRSGLSRETLDRLRALTERRASTVLTARVISDELGIQPRTARRIASKLERAGMARAVGQENTGVSGRPATVYELLF